MRYFNENKLTGDAARDSIRKWEGDIRDSMATLTDTFSSKLELIDIDYDFYWKITIPIECEMVDSHDHDGSGVAMNGEMVEFMPILSNFTKRVRHQLDVDDINVQVIFKEMNIEILVYLDFEDDEVEVEGDVSDIGWEEDLFDDDQDTNNDIGNWLADRIGESVIKKFNDFK